MAGKFRLMFNLSVRFRSQRASRIDAINRVKATIKSDEESAMKNYIISATLIIMTLGLVGCDGSDETVKNIATLTWVAPTTRIDGSFVPMSEIAGYKIYRGASSDSMIPVVIINDPYTMEYQFSTFTLDDDTYYFSVTAFDTDDLESDIPEPINKTFI